MRVRWDVVSFLKSHLCSKMASLFPVLAGFTIARCFQKPKTGDQKFW